MENTASNSYWLDRLRPCPGRLLEDQRGQTIIEYMLITGVIVVGMAVSLEVFFGALSSLLTDLGTMVSSPYP